MKPIFCLTGKKRSGKTTSIKLLDEILKNVYGINMNDYIDVLNFADELKKDVCDIYGFTLDYIEEKKNSNEMVANGMTMRQLIQSHGSKRRKEYGRNYWTDKVIDKINPSKYTIIGDMRFLDEYETMKEIFYENMSVILVKRENYIDDGDTHESETEVEKIPYNEILYNTETPKELIEMLHEKDKFYYFKKNVFHLFEDVIWDIVEEEGNDYDVDILDLQVYSLFGINKEELSETDDKVIVSVEQTKYI